MESGSILVCISIPGYPDSDDWQCLGLGPDQGRRRNGLLLSSTHTSLSVSCDYIPHLLVCLDACPPPIAYLLCARCLLIEPAQPLLSSDPSRRSQARDGHHSQASMVRPNLDVTVKTLKCALHRLRSPSTSWWSHFRTRIPPSTTLCSSRHL